MSTEQATRERPVSAPAAPAAKKVRRFFPELEGMRGFAVLMLVCTHIGISNGVVGYQGHPGAGFAGAVLNRLEVSLPIFFILSGMLLYRPFALATILGDRRPSLSRYFWRRALRVVPAYFVLVAVALALFNQSRIHGVWDVLRPLLFLQVYQENALPVGMEQTWSLSTEFAFYVSLPLLAALFGRLARRGPTPAARARRILLPLGGMVVLAAGFAAYSHRPSVGTSVFEHLWPVEWVMFLAAGMALATMSAAAEVDAGAPVAPYRAMLRHPVLSWAGAVVAFFLACYLPIGGTKPGEPNASADFPDMGGAVAHQLSLLVVSVLLVGPLTAPVRRSAVVRAAMGNRVMQFLGRVSYGIFLWHITVIYLYQGDLFSGHTFWRSLAIVAPLAVAAATLSFYVIERPAMRQRPWEWEIGKRRRRAAA